MTAITSAKDLLNNAQFIGFCRYWQETGRCPLPMVDYLIEQGLSVQAEAARWAATERVRKQFWKPEEKPIPPAPDQLSSGHWQWIATITKDDEESCHDEVNVNYLNMSPLMLGFYSTETFEESVCFLFDLWKEQQ